MKYDSEWCGSAIKNIFYEKMNGFYDQFQSHIQNIKWKTKIDTRYNYIIMQYIHFECYTERKTVQ